MTIVIKPAATRIAEEIKPLTITVPDGMFDETAAYIRAAVELTYPQMEVKTEPYTGDAQDRSKLFLSAYNMALNDVNMRNNLATPNVVVDLDVFDITTADILLPISTGHFISTMTDYAITYALITIARLGDVSFLEHLRFHINVDLP